MSPLTALSLIVATIAAGVFTSLAIVHVVRKHWDEKEHRRHIDQARTGGRWRVF